MNSIYGKTIVKPVETDTVIKKVVYMILGSIFQLTITMSILLMDDVALRELS